MKCNPDSTFYPNLENNLPSHENCRQRKERTTERASTVKDAKCNPCTQFTLDESVRSAAFPTKIMLWVTFCKLPTAEGCAMRWTIDTLCTAKSGRRTRPRREANKSR